MDGNGPCNSVMLDRFTPSQYNFFEFKYQTIQTANEVPRERFLSPSPPSLTLRRSRPPTRYRENVAILRPFPQPTERKRKGERVEEFFDPLPQPWPSPPSLTLFPSPDPLPLASGSHKLLQRGPDGRAAQATRELDQVRPTR